MANQVIVAADVKAFYTHHWRGLLSP